MSTTHLHKDLLNTLFLRELNIQLQNGNQKQYFIKTTFKAGQNNDNNDTVVILVKLLASQKRKFRQVIQLKDVSYSTHLLGSGVFNKITPLVKYFILKTEKD